MLLFHKGPDRVDMLSCAVKSTCSSKSLDHNLLIACVLGYRSLQMCVCGCVRVLQHFRLHAKG